jgi:hypothetical protein
VLSGSVDWPAVARYPRYFRPWHVCRATREAPLHIPECRVETISACHEKIPSLGCAVLICLGSRRAYSRLHIGGPSIYPAWRLRPEYLPSSASCSGVRGGAAFSRRIALSRMGSMHTRIQKKVVSESKLKRKISLRHCIHIGKHALGCCPSASPTRAWGPARRNQCQEHCSWYEKVFVCL